MVKAPKSMKAQKVMKAQKPKRAQKPKSATAPKVAKAAPKKAKAAMKAEATAKPKANSQKGVKHGQASSLKQRGLWELWLRFVLDELGPHMAVLLFFTDALCLRVGQAGALKGADFDLGRGRVRIGAFKAHLEDSKHMVPSVLNVVRRLVKSGLKGKKHAKACGARGVAKDTPTFKWHQGLLFPTRAGAADPHVGKDTVGHAIRRVRGGFPKAARKAGFGDINVKSVRTHCGRRHAITRMVAGKAPDDIGMKYAQISAEQVYRKYADIDHDDVAKVLDKMDVDDPFVGRLWWA